MDILTGATILVLYIKCIKYNQFCVSDYHLINVDFTTDDQMDNVFWHHYVVASLVQPKTLDGVKE